jgi:hypothetical protein
MELSLILIIVIGIVVFQLVQSWRKERAIQHSPLVQTPAKVITTYSSHKRDPWGTLSAGREMACYAIFELKTGERKVFEVESRYLVEGTQGILTYQGDRFLNFQH